MLFNLLVCKFEYLETIRVSRLSSFSLREVVDDPLVREGLLDIFICKVNDQVPIRESLPSNTIRKNDLFLARSIDPLNFAIMADYLLDNLRVGWSLLVVFIWEFEAVVLFEVINLLVDLLGFSIFLLSVDFGVFGRLTNLAKWVSTVLWLSASSFLHLSNLRLLLLLLSRFRFDRYLILHLSQVLLQLLILLLQLLVHLPESVIFFLALFSTVVALLGNFRYLSF